ncbi:MAG: hypothetical protein GX557_01510 [Chloroflexi bacterium]|nr:hypothetical protein [Chloroflexota bacterium]
MTQSRIDWRTALIGLAALTLLVAGVAIIIYVSVARDRLLPTPTPLPTATARSVATLEEPSATPQPLKSVIAVVQDYPPGALIIVLQPGDSGIDQVIVPEDVVVMWAQEREVTPYEIAAGQTIYAEGVLDALGRLVAQRIIIVREAPPTPAPSPSATPSPLPNVTPTPGLTWRGEYYGNEVLAGPPLLERDDYAIDFYWQLGAPHPSLPADGFSVRWRGRWTFEQGAYRFYAYSDDGVRIWLDDELVIDQWRDQTVALVYTDLNVTAGPHEIRVEYFDRLDNAQVRVWWEYRQFFPDWKGEYYANPILMDEPVLTRNDATIDFAWGDAAPAGVLPADQFSARWTRTAILPQGAYRFHASADDGVRVWVNDRIVIDEWHEGALATYTGHIWLDAGAHVVRVEYFEANGGAEVHLWWERIESFRGWKGEYFPNADLAGKPAFVRDDETVAFDWQLRAPAPGMPSDDFSARWSRTVYFPAGDYVFWTIADDGVRLYIDGDLIIDEWRDSAAEWHEAEVLLDDGEHEVTLEFYERGDRALVQLNWGLLPTPTPSPTATMTPGLTPSPTPSPTAAATETLTPTPTP